MDLRQQILESQYSPLVIFRKNVEWTQGEAEKLDAALEGIDAAALLAMPAEKIEALNESRRQAITLRTRANDFAAQAAPYVQPKPQPIDDPINLTSAALPRPRTLQRMPPTVWYWRWHPAKSLPEQAGNWFRCDREREGSSAAEIERRLIALKERDDDT
jgi:hypothetical protein